MSYKSNKLDNLFAAAKNNLSITDAVIRNSVMLLQEILKEVQGYQDYINFNDETGIPEWYSQATGKSRSIYAIKIVGSDEIFIFDDNFEPTDENLSDDSKWFSPYSDGDFEDEEDLLSCIETFNELHNE